MRVRGSALDCDSPCVTAVLAPAPLSLVLAEAAAAAVLAIARPGDSVSGHLDRVNPLTTQMAVSTHIYISIHKYTYTYIQIHT